MLALGEVGLATCCLLVAQLVGSHCDVVFEKLPFGVLEDINNKYCGAKIDKFSNSTKS
jgi:hypothetical protein